MDNRNHLQSTNYENSVLFLISCFQYILVAAVFSIGPPYRKPMWTNGTINLLQSQHTADFVSIAWLMSSMCLLSVFNIWVLLAPAKVVSTLLTLMPLPLGARYTLLMVAVINVGVSLSFERWGAQRVSDLVGAVTLWLHRGRRRVREGKAYKAVEGGMR